MAPEFPLVQRESAATWEMILLLAHHREHPQHSQGEEGGKDACMFFFLQMTATQSPWSPPGTWLSR